VLTDASYGSNKALRDGITALELTYAAAIVPTVKVRPVRAHDAKERRVSVKDLALSLPKHAWRTITWREGTNAPLRSHFARVQVRVAPIRGAAKCAEETLLIEWPAGEAAPTKYWLATVEQKISFRSLVDIVKMRWRIERDYLDLKQEIGLGHYEGRGWQGFHHHGTLSIAAYGFLVSERETIPPSEPRSTGGIEKPALPGGYRPRGAPDQARAPRPQLDRHDSMLAGRRDRTNHATMPTLPGTQPPARFAPKFVTQ
jgi:SRSO17 transposase